MWNHILWLFQHTHIPTQKFGLTKFLTLFCLNTNLFKIQHSILLLHPPTPPPPLSTHRHTPLFTGSFRSRGDEMGGVLIFLMEFISPTKYHMISYLCEKLDVMKKENYFYWGNVWCKSFFVVIFMERSFARDTKRWKKKCVCVCGGGGSFPFF